MVSPAGVELDSGEQAGCDAGLEGGQQQIAAARAGLKQMSPPWRPRNELAREPHRREELRERGIARGLAEEIERCSCHSALPSRCGARAHVWPVKMACFSCARA